MEDKIQKVILDVPYCSQHLDVENENWRSRACGIVCLKMVMDFYGKNLNVSMPSISKILNEILFIKGFNGNHDVTHEGLIMIARNYGFHAYGQEFRSLSHDYINKKTSKSAHEDRLTEEGICKKVEKLEAGSPVIVSVAKKFSEKDKSHLIVLTGFEKNGGDLKGFYYNDPDSFDTEGGKNKFVDINTFKKYWRKFSIHVGS